MPSAMEAKPLALGGVQEAVQSRIDELGFGPFQLIMLLATGGMMMAEGSEVLIMGAVTKLLGVQWQLSPFLKGFMVSTVYLGFALGNMCAGNLGDRFGRRPTLLLAYTIVGVVGMMTSFVNHPFEMICLRFIVGAGVGLGFPCVFSLIPEVVPMRLRGAVTSAMIGFMPLGELFASLGVMAIDPNLTDPNSWRALVRWSAIPAFGFALLCLGYLWESPLLLARQGREDELNEMLDSIAAWNMHKPAPRLELTRQGAAEIAAPEAGGASRNEAKESFSWTAAAGRVFSDRYRTTALVIFYLNFAKDFSYFGLNFVFPQYFQRLAIQHPEWHFTTAMEMVVASIVAWPGVALAVWLMQSPWIGNITLVFSLASASGLATFGLLNCFPPLMNFVFVCIVKFLTLAFFMAVIVYTSEVFPTSIRTTAVGICIGFGRSGSISAPVVFEAVQKMGGYNPFWTIIICILFLAAITSKLFLTIDTKGKYLVDEEVVQEADPDASYGSVEKGKISKEFYHDGKP